VFFFIYHRCLRKIIAKNKEYERSLTGGTRYDERVNLSSFKRRKGKKT
jgi:hypothetical protein